MSEDNGFGRLALKGGILTAGSQAVKIVVQLSSVILLARLLEPADFGLVASVAPLVAFIALFQDLGFQQAVIQKKDISDEQLNRIFWVTAAAGVLSSIVVIASAPLAVVFYGDERLLWITVAMSLPLLTGSLSALPLSLLSRRMSYGSLAANDIVATLGGFAFGIAAAYSGLGYWAIVVGAAAPAFITLGMAFLSSRWRPGKPDLRIEKSVMAFGANLTGFNVVNFLARNADNIIIGRAFGAVPLGYYDRAYKLFLSPLAAINAPAGRIMLPILSRMQDDKERLRKVYLKVCWIIAAITIPGIATIGMTSEATVRLLFGERWMEAAPILGWLALAGLFQPLSNASGWLFLSQGKTKQMLHWGLFSSGITVASFFVGLPWGVTGVAAAYAISGLAIRTPVLVYVLHKVGPVKAVDLISIKLVFVTAAAIAMSICHALQIANNGSDLLTFAATAAVNFTVAGTALMFFPVSRAVLLEATRIAAGAWRSKKRTDVSIGSL